MNTRNYALPILAAAALAGCSSPEPYPEEVYEGVEVGQTEQTAPAESTHKPKRRTTSEPESRPRSESTPRPKPKPTPTSAPQSTPEPRSETVSQPTSAPAPAPDPNAEVPYGKPVPGKSGYVTSPFSPGSGYIDVNGLAPGSKARDPYTNKIFRVP